MFLLKGYNFIDTFDVSDLRSFNYYWIENKMKSLIIQVISVLALAIVSGCSHHEYAKNYISPNPTDFDQYKREASKRPSPPARTTQNVDGANVFITYCQPSVKGREIWGELVKYDKIWRTGANEATVLTFEKEMSINNETVKPGNYALYTIPGKDKWTVILNTKYDVWGAYDYDSKLDAVRFDVTPVKSEIFEERMIFDLDDKGIVTFSWEYLSFQFAVVTS